MMETRLMVESPDDIEFTMTITMSAKEWGKLQYQLESAWPSSTLSAAIMDLLAQSRKVFYSAPEQDE